MVFLQKDLAKLCSYITISYFPTSFFFIFVVVPYFLDYILTLFIKGDLKIITKNVQNFAYLQGLAS